VQEAPKCVYSFCCAAPLHRRCACARRHMHVHSEENGSTVLAMRQYAEAQSHMIGYAASKSVMRGASRPLRARGAHHSHTLRCVRSGDSPLAHTTVPHGGDEPMQGATHIKRRGQAAVTHSVINPVRCATFG
jgi:hypothetical protein